MARITVLSIVICLLLSISVSAQKKLSLSASVGKGLSWFSGEGSTYRSVYYRNGLSFPNSVDTIANHWGQIAKGNFLAGLQVDLKLSHRWVLQFGAHYERSGGRLIVDSVHTPSGNFRTNGKYYEYYDYISLNPQVGYLLTKKVAKLTLHAGIDYTSKLDRGNQFDFVDPTNKRYSIGGSGGEPEVNDCRLTGGLMINVKKWGLDFNYKHGITNYNKYSDREVYSRLLHLRLLYRIL
jgi:hypothetical protein